MAQTLTKLQVPTPRARPRRLRTGEAFRGLVRETRLHPSQLLAPIFVTGGSGVRQPIDSLPGHARLSPDLAVELGRELKAAGVGGVLFFGIPDAKDEIGSGAADPRGPVPAALRAFRDAGLDLVLVADVCMCEYTSHGHCGALRGEQVDNDATLPLLAEAAVAYAAAGADIVAPSAMMDGQVAALRAGLDQAGHLDTAILAYAAKAASVFYGPFREAAGSTPAFGDRRAYQMDPANGREALRELELDLQEGADMLMVKPALTWLDVLATARDRFDVPLAAYQVSGEAAMIEAAAARGWLDRRRAVMETLTSIRRAGAQVQITYFALEVARWLND